MNKELENIVRNNSCHVASSDDKGLIMYADVIDLNMEDVDAFEKVLEGTKSLCIFREEDDSLTCVFKWKEENE